MKFSLGKVPFIDPLELSWNSYLLIRPPKLDSNRFDPDSWSSWSTGIVGGSVFADVRFCNRLVPHKFKPYQCHNSHGLFVLGWCIALGGTTALDTLGSQAFTGGNQRTTLSIQFQRCVFLLWILFIPIGILWAYIEPVLLSLGQPEALSNGVQKFLRILLFGAPAYIGFESLKKYLQCQGMSDRRDI